MELYISCYISRTLISLIVPTYCLLSYLYIITYMYTMFLAKYVSSYMDVYIKTVPNLFYEKRV